MRGGACCRDGFKVGVNGKSSTGSRGGRGLDGLLRQPGNGLGRSLILTGDQVAVADGVGLESGPASKRAPSFATDFPEDRELYRSNRRQFLP